MFDPTRTRYDLLVQLATGDLLRLGPALTALTWSESDDEFAVRVQARVLNQVTSAGTLHQLLGAGSRLLLQYDVGQGWVTEVLAMCVEPEYEDSGIPSVNVLAFDDLWPLLTNENDYVFDAGHAASLLIETVLAENLVAGGDIRGPHVAMPKMVFRGTDGDTLAQILGEAFYRSGSEARHILRARPLGGQTVADVVPVGSNSPVYHLRLVDGIEGLRDRWSIQGLVTEALIVGETYEVPEDDAEAAPVRAPIRYVVQHPDPAIRAFGRLRRILTSQTNDSEGAVAVRAQNLFDEEGHPKREASVICADIPFLRRGDAIRLEGGTLDGRYVVSAVTHDALAKKMTLTIRHGGSRHYRARQGVEELVLPDEDDPDAAAVQETPPLELPALQDIPIPR